MGFNFQELKQQNDIVDVIGRHLHLKKKGSEYVGICPFHDDSHSSLQVNPSKQIFKCFACGAGGDVIDFLTNYGKTIQEAAEILGGNSSDLGAPIQNRSSKKPTRTVWTQILEPLNQPNSFSHYQYGEPSKIWAYRNLNGSIRGYICRFDTEGGKQVIPYTFCSDGQRFEWRWQGFASPRPIYRLNEVAAATDRTVIVVEGEKTADALAALVEGAGKAIVTTWIGGANGIHQTDWSALNGRKLVMWPDNDWSHHYGAKHATNPNGLKPWNEQPGNAAMLQIAELAKPQLAKYVRNPDGKPCGWDIADEQWTAEETRKYILANSFDEIREVADYAEQVTEQAAAPEPPADMPPPPPPEFEDDEPEDLNDNPYFRFLGYFNDGGRPTHCFYPNGNKLIVKLNTSQMTVSSLMDLAPLAYWEHNLPNKGKAKFDVDAATNWLSNTSQAVGIFSTKNIRGRGAWFDDGRTILHAGSHLVVDGQQTLLGKLRSRYIYEVGEPLGFSHRKPLQAAEAAKLVDLTKLLNWERDINAYLLAGWCVVAPICGALKWRPHIWITGGAGTGKSWVFKEIVRRLLGETGLAVQGETSEAGLRQSLGHDALPVVFDEAEAEDKRSQERIQTVLTLMRSASADDGGVMAKGSAGGSAVTYRIRSCFAFASIGVSVSQQADRSRVTILGLKKLRDDDPVRIDRWSRLTELYSKLITDDFVERLQARTLSMVPIIIKNAATFANAVTSVIGVQRTGDQLGALLAGAYSLHKSSVISYEDAVKWVSDKDWNEERGLEATRDEFVLLSHLMEQLTTVETQAGRYERQIGELILIASLERADDFIGNDTAQNRLRRIGFKVDRTGFFYISNRSSVISKMLGGTPWEKNHSRTLLRIDGAVSVESTTFAAGLKGRAVALPISLLL